MAFLSATFSRGTGGDDPGNLRKPLFYRAFAFVRSGNCKNAIIHIYNHNKNAIIINYGIIIPLPYIDYGVFVGTYKNNGKGRENGGKAENGDPVKRSTPTAESRLGEERRGRGQTGRPRGCP